MIKDLTFYSTPTGTLTKLLLAEPDDLLLIKSVTIFSALTSAGNIAPLSFPKNEINLQTNELDYMGHTDPETVAGHQFLPVFGKPNGLNTDLYFERVKKADILKPIAPSVLFIYAINDLSTILNRMVIDYEVRKLSELQRVQEAYR